MTLLFFFNKKINLHKKKIGLILWSDLLPIYIMKKQDKYLKANAFAEKKIIENIVSNKWKAGDFLPPERELAVLLGITRPTLRETLQRLSAEGWITIHHGKPTTINNFQEAGSLGILKTLTKYTDLTPDFIVSDWLDFRIMILPELAQKAVKKNAQKILAKLKQKPAKNAKAATFALFDWEIQDLIVKLSENSIAKMIFNDLRASYILHSQKYFVKKENKHASVDFYEQLEKTIAQKPETVFIVVKKAMEISRDNFTKTKNNIKNTAHSA